LFGVTKLFIYMHHLYKGILEKSNRNHLFYRTTSNLRRPMEF